MLSAEGMDKNYNLEGDCMKTRKEIEDQIEIFKHSFKKNEITLSRMSFDHKLYSRLAGAKEVFRQRILMLEWVLEG
jgi:hypothetical protein